MNEMESPLLWPTSKYVPLNISIIQTKTSLYEDWKTRFNEDINTVFQASNRRFIKFSMRYSLQNIKFIGESMQIKMLPNNFCLHCLKLLKMDFPIQITNLDMRVYFEKIIMPNNTFLSKKESVAPGRKPSKNRLTFFLAET